MNVLDRQYGIMADRSMGEGREFVNYKATPSYPHGGVCYNWNAAGDLKNYTGTTEQWAAIQMVAKEMSIHGTIIIATYLSATNESVRLKLSENGDVYFIAPDGSINTLTATGLYIEESGGKAAKQILAGLLCAGTNAKYNDCSKYDVLTGAINYNWDKAGLLKDYDGTTWYALDVAKTDMSENGTVYFATYDANSLVQLKLDRLNMLYYTDPDGKTVILRDLSAEQDLLEEDTVALSRGLVPGYCRVTYPVSLELGTKLQIYPTVVRINGTHYENTSSVILSLDEADSWDDETYALAENRAGLDVYIYACVPTIGTVPVYKFSADATVPVGYTAATSRKIGGFHCECADIPEDTTWVVDYLGTTEPHKLAGLLLGYVIPASIWDLYHRPKSAVEGMLYSDEVNIWVDIYLAGWDGQKLVSQFNATTADGTFPLAANPNPIYGNAGIDGETMHILAHHIGKRSISRNEFMSIAEGSNERTAITGATDPTTTGGHVDTANRRMVSNIGCEDCCGFLWQWTSDFAAIGGSGWNLGQIYTGNNKDISGRGYCGGAMRVVQVGGAWSTGAYNGSAAVYCISLPAVRTNTYGGRLVSEPLLVKAL